ncbi:FtsX-like permease family protein [Actinoplanes subtropicus]|uniref:FtsX-like permease family protein n=1 Tax=Actinoplanes subtropicus TaxID=543632 RepID=UPI0004C310D4|nr:FtsX-like permease family protein [Actinoplanes subtropicus]
MMVHRIRAAASLLIAAAVVAWCAVALLAGLSTFGRAVAEAGVRSAVAHADPADRSILVRGVPGGDAGTGQRWDAAVRRAHPGMAVDAAGYSSGRAFQRPPAARMVSPAYASITFLEHLPAHARLTAGRWPSPGAMPVQTALGEAVAETLGVRPGDRIPVVDRLDGSVTSLAVTGVWRPLDPADAYWRLAPDVFAGVAPQSATYGPVVVDRADFARWFPGSASLAWLVEPDLSEVSSGSLRRLAGQAIAAGTGLPPPSGLDQSASLETGLPDLAERMARAELVGRSALVTPVLLVTVLGGYVLVLVASLLAENRRGEVALLRARGAARGRLAVLAAQESAVVVLPAVVFAVPASVALLAVAGRIFPLSRDLGLHWRLSGAAWLVALAAAAGCALAVTLPALRGGGTYTAELAERSRPPARSPFQRMGLDLALVALAVVGWLQLRQYGTPLGGTLGIDPLLASGPTLGVLTATVLSLRLARPVAQLVGRSLGRSAGLSATFGAWQAGRRGHAGPVVLVALAVAAGTVSWCMAGTAARSVADQVDLRAGADLRLTEVSGSAPAGRAGQLAALPGVARVLPAWRYQVTLGPDGGTGDLVAVDTTAADVALVRKDVAGGDPGGLYARLAAGRARAAQSVPVAVTPGVLDRLHLHVGESTTLTLAGLPAQVVVVGTMAAVPGTDGGPAVLADLPTLSSHVRARDNATPAPQEWWLATTAAGHRAATPAAAALSGLRVTDRSALREEAARDPFGVGARGALFGAAGGCLLLAAVGLAVDTWATARRRASELAVLQTLGAGRGLVARSLLVEQALLAGAGAGAGLLCGVLVATVTAPLVLLTPAATRPVPVPIPQIDWWRSSGTAMLLLAIALGASVLATAGSRGRSTVAQLRWGSDR